MKNIPHRKILHLPSITALAVSILLQQPTFAGSNTFKLSGLTITLPPGWVRMPVSSPMRAAELSVPPMSADVGQEPGEVVFFHFPPGDGGAVDANVRRWIGQFEESPQEAQARTAAEEHGGLRVTFVAAQGTYKSGIPGGPTTPKPGFALRGAIIETPRGNVFIRFTGPLALVERHEEAFNAMVRLAALSTSGPQTPASEQSVTENPEQTTN